VKTLYSPLTFLNSVHPWGWPEGWAHRGKLHPLRANTRVVKNWTPLTYFCNVPGRNSWTWNHLPRQMPVMHKMSCRDQIKAIHSFTLLKPKKRLQIFVFLFCTFSTLQSSKTRKVWLWKKTEMFHKVRTGRRGPVALAGTVETETLRWAPTLIPSWELESF
jgi:hypothetical protein